MALVKSGKVPLLVPCTVQCAYTQFVDLIVSEIQLHFCVDYIVKPSNRPTNASCLIAKVVQFWSLGVTYMEENYCLLWSHFIPPEDNLDLMLEIFRIQNKK